MKRPHLTRIALSVSLTAAAACAAAELAGPAADKTATPPVAAASGRPAALTPTEYVLGLERLEASVNRRESDLLALHSAGPGRGQYGAALAHAKEQKKIIRSMLSIGRRALALVNGSGVAAATCTDEGEPDECDGGGSGGAPPWNSTSHTVLNGSGALPGESLAVSYGLITVTNVHQNHQLRVRRGGNLIHADSAIGNVPLLERDTNFIGIYPSRLNYSVCGATEGWSVHTFTMPSMPSEQLRSQNFDSTCRTEEESSEGGGGGGGGGEKEGDLWCWFISTYDSNGNLVSRQNTGNCWIM